MSDKKITLIKCTNCNWIYGTFMNSDNNDNLYINCNHCHQKNVRVNVIDDTFNDPDFRKVRDNGSTICLIYPLLTNL